MFKGTVNYFQNKGTKNKYPKICDVWDWVEVAPPDTLLKNVKKEQQKFIKKINNYQIVQRNYQDEINRQYATCLTLEKVFKSNIQLEPSKTYQSTEASTLNAQDMKDAISAAKDKIIKTQAEEAANKQIQEYYKKINEIKANQNKQGENK